MTLSERLHRLSPPVLRGAFEGPLWFADREEEALPFDPRLDRNHAFPPLVPEGVREQLDQCWEQNLRIDLEGGVSHFDFPLDSSAFVRMIGDQSLPEVPHEIGSRVTHFSQSRLTERRGETLQVRTHLGNHGPQAFDLFFQFRTFRELGEISGLQFGGIEVIAEIVGQLSDKLHHVRQ